MDGTPDGFVPCTTQKQLETWFAKGGRKCIVQITNKDETVIGPFEATATQAIHEYSYGVGFAVQCTTTSLLMPRSYWYWSPEKVCKPTDHGNNMQNWHVVALSMESAVPSEPVIKKKIYPRGCGR